MFGWAMQVRPKIDEATGAARAGKESARGIGLRCHFPGLLLVLRVETAVKICPHRILTLTGAYAAHELFKGVTLDILRAFDAAMPIPDTTEDEICPHDHGRPIFARRVCGVRGLVHAELAAGVLDDGGGGGQAVRGQCGRPDRAVESLYCPPLSSEQPNESGVAPHRS